MDPVWYLGPLGFLRPLPTPEPGISIADLQYGGIHQGLSGARVKDITGTRADYGFEWKWLDQAEWAWFDAMNTGVVPGPYRLINPLKKNRLSPQASASQANASSNLGLALSSSRAQNRDFPTAVGIPGRSLSIYSWTGTSQRVAFDQMLKTPVFPAEVVTFSLYARGLAGHTATLFIEWYGVDGELMSASSTDTVPITTAWQRFAITRGAPIGAASAVPVLQLGSANTTVRVAAPQFETGAAVTPWAVGGAAPTVLINQLSTTSPRFPLRDASLTLLEA